MLAFTLSSLKDATSHLFTQPSFDDFDVLSVTIVSYITFSMDGHLNAAFLRMLIRSLTSFFPGSVFALSVFR